MQTFRKPIAGSFKILVIKFCNICLLVKFYLFAMGDEVNRPSRPLAYLMIHINRTFKNADKDLKKLASLCICFGFSLDLLLNESGWVLFGIVKDQKENLSEMEKLSDECLKLKA